MMRRRIITWRQLYDIYSRHNNSVDIIIQRFWRLERKAPPLRNRWACDFGRHEPRQLHRVRVQLSVSRRLVSSRDSLKLLAIDGNASNRPLSQRQSDKACFRCSQPQKRTGAFFFLSNLPNKKRITSPTKRAVESFISNKLCTQENLLELKQHEAQRRGPRLISVGPLRLRFSTPRRWHAPWNWAWAEWNIWGPNQPQNHTTPAEQSSQWLSLCVPCSRCVQCTTCAAGDGAPPRRAQA